MTSNQTCKYCKNKHSVIGDVVCGVSFNRNSMLMKHENNKEPWFAMELVTLPNVPRKRTAMTTVEKTHIKDKLSPEEREKFEAYEERTKRWRVELAKEYTMEEATQRLKNIISKTKNV